MVKRKKRNRTNTKINKSLNIQKDIPLTGDYLKEQQLIDNLSCRIQEKYPLNNIPPAKINLPYPKIQVKNKNKKYAEILSRDFCSGVSEFTAISQYINHEIRLSNKYFKASETILSISKTEMIHMQMIGEIITLLGENLNYSYYNNGSYSHWTSKFVDFGTNYVNMILLDINDEYKAIKQYEEHIEIIDDTYIKAILNRIIKDEKYHIELLTALLDENNYSKSDD